MRIAVVGAGNMGRALARRWIRAGHSVSLSFSRSPSTLLQWAAPFGSLASVNTPRDAVAGADAVLLSVPFDALDTAINLIGEGHWPVPLVTTVSPYRADFTGEQINLESRLAERSAAEATAQRLPDFQVVEAFNLVFADLLAKDTFPFRAPTVPLCGDHAGAKSVISDLIRDAGLFFPERHGRSLPWNLLRQGMMISGPISERFWPARASDLIETTCSSFQKQREFWICFTSRRFLPVLPWPVFCF